MSHTKNPPCPHCDKEMTAILNNDLHGRWETVFLCKECRDKGLYRIPDTNQERIDYIDYINKYGRPR